jgi:hypothetical protein
MLRPQDTVLFDSEAIGHWSHCAYVSNSTL